MPKQLTQEELLARDMSEAELQEAIMDLALGCNWLVFHIRDSRRQQVVGLPDLILMRPGQMEFWELKRELGKISVEQERVLQMLRLCYQVVRVVRPSDWLSNRVEEWLA